MDIYVDSLLSAAKVSLSTKRNHRCHPPCFRWKTSYAFKDVSLSICCKIPISEENEDDESSSASDDKLFFSWGETKEKEHDPVEEYIQQNGVFLRRPRNGSAYCFSNHHGIVGDNEDGDFLEDNYYEGNNNEESIFLLEDAVGVDFIDQRNLAGFLLDLLMVASVRYNSGETPLFREQKKFKSEFLEDTLDSLLKSNAIQNGDDNLYTFQIDLACNETINKRTAMEEFVSTFGRLRNGWGSVTRDQPNYAYVLHKRHLAFVLFQRATSLRRLSFHFKDDTNPGFGPVYREGLAFAMDLEDGRLFEMYGFTYYDGPYD